MFSVLIILKYIVCVIFVASVVLVCFYIPPDSFEGFLFFGPTGCLYNYDFILQTLTVTA